MQNGKRYTWSVHDAVWKKAEMRAEGRRPLGKGEFLCVDCLQGRLGRELTFADLAYPAYLTVSAKQVFVFAPVC